MQDPNEDTEWNDVLRAKGILPPKEKKVNYNMSSFSMVSRYSYLPIHFLLTNPYLHRNLLATYILEIYISSYKLGIV